MWQLKKKKNKTTKGLWCHLGPVESYANITSKGHPKGQAVSGTPRSPTDTASGFGLVSRTTTDGKAIFQHLEEGGFFPSTEPPTNAPVKCSHTSRAYRTDVSKHARFRQIARRFRRGSGNAKNAA